MCLKLVKQLDSIDRLPINHTIFKHLADKENHKQPDLPKIDAKSLLFTEFERAQKTAYMANNVQRYDSDSGLPFCLFHQDRVEHFYCETHKVNWNLYRVQDVEFAYKWAIPILSAEFSISI